MSEPWNDPDFMEWAFGKKEISLTPQGFHIVLDRLYEVYFQLQDLYDLQKYITKSIANDILKQERHDENRVE
jgi:hypothetical protein